MPGLDSAAFCPTQSAPLPLLPPEDIFKGEGGFKEKPFVVGNRRKDGRLLEEMRPIRMRAPEPNLATWDFKFLSLN